MKGGSSRKLQIEFPDLKKRYWGRHFWAIGFGCWSTGNTTDEMVNQYMEHHRNPNENNNNDNFIIEDLQRADFKSDNQIYGLSVHSGLLILKEINTTSIIK
jgi:putative transposase